MSSAVPEGWRAERLGDVSALITKGTTPKAYSNEGVNFIKVESVSTNRTLIMDKFSKVDLETHNLQKRSQLESGDILFSIAGSLGRIAVVRSEHLPANTNQALALIRLKDADIDNAFCIQQLSAGRVQSELKNLQTVGAQPNLSLQQVSDLLINCPPLPEQKKIASILTSVDEVIETTQKQIDKLQDLKKATMNELLTKGIGHTEFKDSELGRIPKSWEVVALGAIGDFSKGKGISKKETTSEGVPCLRYAEIYTEYDFVIGNFKSFIRSETISTTKKLKTNDIIFAGSGETVEDIGKSVAFVSDCDAYVGGDSIVFSPNIQCNSVFLSYQLNDDLRRIQLRKLGQGSSVIHVYTSGIMQLNISLPPLLEQNKIAETLLSYTRAIAAKKQKLAQTQSLKKSLMQDLLTGKVRVQVN